MENKWVLITGASGDIGRITTDQVLKFTEFNIILTTNSKKLNLDSSLSLPPWTVSNNNDE